MMRKEGRKDAKKIGCKEGYWEGGREEAIK